MSRYNLALLLEQSGRRSEARHQLARAADLAPDDADVLSEYARVLEAAGQTDTARAVRARIARLPPPPPRDEPTSGETPE
jgi:Flp pilus assembly protein TadD